MARGNPLKDETGNRYGRLLVSGRAPNRGNIVMWACVCDCGSYTEVQGGALRRGVTTSCGCYRIERVSASLTSHGMTGTKEHATWMAITQRCTTPTCKAYPNYGGRGIAMCDRWRNGEGDLTGFECFLKDMGPRPSAKHSIERDDNEKGYGPDNCRWATKKEQLNNTRRCHRITIGGETRTVTQWCEITGVKRSTAFARIGKGWDKTKAVTE